MTTAVVLSGGGSLGAVQAGMLLALEEAGVVPDLIVGTSVGAINAAYVAARSWPGATAGIDAIWTSVSRAEVFRCRSAASFVLPAAAVTTRFRARGSRHSSDATCRTS